MITSITIVRYRRAGIPLALLAMAWQRLPLKLNKRCRFWKLMGSGKGGSFSLKPDWTQWALLTVWDKEQDHEDFLSGSVISRWWDRFATERYTILCKTLSSHGKWDDKEPFIVESVPDHTGPVLVLTRARIRFSRLRNFWSHVEAAAEEMARSEGYVFSVGVGEAPVYLQATVSVWTSAEAMKNFAYRSQVHKEVIRKTRVENWYSEELFARFAIISSSGSIHGRDPLAEMQGRQALNSSPDTGLPQ